MITIYFNNAEIKIIKNISLTELLAEKYHNNDCIAVALNRQFVPRIQYAKTFLQENDSIEIITPMQGG
jgi:sulfur carrier protein